MIDENGFVVDENKMIYQKALETYGEEAQITMVFEEMAELQKELCKSLRGKQNIGDIAEEIADVEIMLEQMKLLFGVGKAVEKAKKYKIARLKERLEGEHQCENGICTF